MSDRVFVTATPFQQLISLFTRAKEVGLKDAGINDWWYSAELAHQAMSILGIPEVDHQGYDPSQPARPVEDREPAGPYAPTRAKPLPGEVQADIAAQRDARTFEAGYRQGWRERDTPGCTPRYPDLTIREASAGSGVNVEWLAERFDRIDTALTKLTDLFVDSRDEIERTMTRPEYLRWKEGFDFGIKGFAEEMATARRETREAFERGRQQGDTDRAREGEDKLIEARAIARAAVEAELLDQGWTPPGATSVDARLLEIVNSDVDGPTDYEVWRDAVAIAGAQRDRRPPAKDLAERLTADAEWFWELLQDVPVLKSYNPERSADQIGPNEDDDYLVRQEQEQTRVTETEAAADLGDIGDGTTFGTNPDDDHIDGDETSWGPGAKIPTKETPGAEADWSGLTD